MLVSTNVRGVSQALMGLAGGLLVDGAGNALGVTALCQFNA